MLEFLGPLIGGIGSAVGGATRSSSMQPQYDPQELLTSFMDTLQPYYDEENAFTKKAGKKERKLTEKQLAPSRQEDSRLKKEIAKNYDMLTDSYMDSAMRGDITGSEALGKFEELEALGLFNPGSVINERGDTSFSKKAAAEKKILEEIMPKERAGRSTVIGATMLGRNLTDEEKAYYNNSNYFKTAEDVAIAMSKTEEGAMRNLPDKYRDMVMYYGFQPVNKTARNPANLPYNMRVKPTTGSPAELAAVSTARTA